jgi:heat shock protein HtpX
MKRIFLFLLTNLAVMFLLLLVVRLLGADRFLTANGLNLPALLVFSAVFGMGGAFISLLMSRWMAKRSTGARVIERPTSQHEVWLMGKVRELTGKAGLPMPEVAIYPSDDMNAFATGASKNKSLIAVSEGLLVRMKPEEVEAVLAHEVGHIKNGDMVTMTLLQGVVNTMVIFLARIAGYAVDMALRGRDNDRGPGIGYFIASMVFEVVFGIIASTVVFAFSRKREFAADQNAAKLVGPRPMIGALAALAAGHGQPLPDSMKAFGIRGGKPSVMGRLFMTHPPIEERIAALKVNWNLG